MAVWSDVRASINKNVVSSAYCAYTTARQGSVFAYQRAALMGASFVANRVPAPSGRGML